ncbi:hypothetical protein LINPERHAP2_LOCUS43122 [Linum perenne]
MLVIRSRVSGPRKLKNTSYSTEGRDTKSGGDIVLEDSLESILDRGVVLL